MWQRFILENFHFAAFVFVGLTLFSAFWLYYDAWVERKTFKEGIKTFGFLILSVSFFLNAPSFSNETVNIIILGAKNLGYLFILIGLSLEPIGIQPREKSAAQYFLIPGLTLFAPFASALISWLYLRKATLGLENHLKKVSIAFFVLTLYEFLNLGSLFVSSTNITIFNAVSVYGPLWIVEHILLIIFSTILISWAFYYLLKRINTQLFIIFTSTIMVIFILTSMSFTFLLLNNLVTETTNRLSVDASVLTFGIDAKRSESMSVSESLSNNSKLSEAITSVDRRVIADMTEETLVNSQAASVVVTDADGLVLARGEERERIGDSLSNDSVVKRALLGEKTSTLIVRDGAIAPEVSVRSGVPVVSNETVVGVVISSITLNNTFMDGIKKTTGLEASIYGGDTLSATTLNLGSRPIGITETTKEVLNTVLYKGDKFVGTVAVLDTDYFAAYTPLTDIDNNPVGMVFVGRPAVTVFQTAEKSIQLTFLIAVALMILSIIPSYLVSKYIANQLK